MTPSTLKSLLRISLTVSAFFLASAYAQTDSNESEAQQLQRDITAEQNFIKEQQQKNPAAYQSAKNSLTRAGVNDIQGYQPTGSAPLGQSGAPVNGFGSVQTTLNQAQIDLNAGNITAARAQLTKATKEVGGVITYQMATNNTLQKQNWTPAQTENAAKTSANTMENAGVSTQKSETIVGETVVVTKEAQANPAAATSAKDQLVVTAAGPNATRTAQGAVQWQGYQESSANFNTAAGAQTRQETKEQLQQDMAAANAAAAAAHPAAAAKVSTSQ